MALDESKAECCPVCYEDFQAAQREEDHVVVEDDDEEAPASCIVPNERVELHSCRHAFCRECLGIYCRHNIAVRRIPIPCPWAGNKDVDCDQFVQTVTVQDLLARDSSVINSAHLVKFERYQKIQKDSSLRPCPKCDNLVSSTKQNHPTPTEDADNSDIEENVDNDDENARRSCHSCHYVFCAVHGDAHPDSLCADYRETREAQQIELSQLALQQWTKPCSHCSARIHKAVGCDHVLCPACHQDMCYRCGTHRFLTGTVVRSCAKCHIGYLDHRYARQYRVRQCILLPFWLPVILLWVVVMSVVSIATLGFGCCFCCGRDLQVANENSVAAAVPAAAAVAFTEQANDSQQHSDFSWRGIQVGFAVVSFPLLTTMRIFGLEVYPLVVLEEYLSVGYLSVGPSIVEIPTLSADYDV